jgi:outer membrane protein TolC
MPVAAELSGPRPVDEYIAFALCQNPEIQVKRKRVEAAAMRVPQAASLEDPLLDVNGWPLYAHAPQQAGGRMTVDVMASQQVPWFGKLRARASAAEAEADAACAELAAAELEVVEQVKRAYYELYLVQTATEITQQSRNLAVEFGKIAEAKYRTGLVDQQDLLRAQLEISNVDVELVRMRQELLSAQARLARLLHVSPETPVRALAELPEEQVPGDIERLYALAIEARPDLHSQLAAIRRDRFNVDLARLQYFPDLTLKFGWGEMTTSRALTHRGEGRRIYRGSTFRGTRGSRGFLGLRHANRVPGGAVWRHKCDSKFSRRPSAGWWRCRFSCRLWMLPAAVASTPS